MNKSFQKGFTLLELLVVIAIIGVIATIGIVSLSSFRIKGRDTKRIADVKVMQGALELIYENENPKSYPAATDTSCGSSPWSGGLASKAAAVGTRALPVDPTNAGTLCYSYVPGSGGQTYTLVAKLEDPKNKPKDALTGTAGSFNCSDASTYCVGL